MGEDLYQQALNLEKQKSFTQAASLYDQALPMLLEENNMELATECSEALQRLTLFQAVYPYKTEQIKDILLHAYPQATTEQIKSWASSKEMEHYVWDGEEHYSADAAQNLKFRYLELMQADRVMEKEYYDLVLDINKLAQENPDYSWMQYQNPTTYRGTHTVSIARDKLPDVGTYRIWFPVPINNGPQAQVAIESVKPDKWVKQPPSIDQDIGLLYMEVPMEELTEDLLIQVQFTFTHYEQRFSVDPDNVGEYDEDSILFQEYTKSYGNTEITSDIRKMADNIVGDETNPYLAARKIYDYIVDNVDYSYMPHFVLWPRTSQTESDYVHRYQRGDCGAQSMYFSAMCRSLGIPARTTGGWQLFKDEFRGHFWAEFYLPNYGWIPVDTSCAQLAKYPKNLTVQQRQTFIDYYFGNQDSMRCVVQKDTDAPLIPQTRGMILLPMAVQVPAVEYSIPTEKIPDEVFLEHWTMQCEKISP
jgi:transglutaminase-like putative cysteine protease